MLFLAAEIERAVFCRLDTISSCRHSNAMMAESYCVCHPAGEGCGGLHTTQRIEGGRENRGAHRIVRFGGQLRSTHSERSCMRANPDGIPGVSVGAAIVVSAKANSV